MPPETPTDHPETTAGDRPGRDPSGRFLPGNPGRPRGSRHAALVALDAIGQEAAEDVLRAVVAAAKAGDMRAADILMRRYLPERKGRPVPFDMPEMRSSADAVQASAAVVAAVASGDLTPEEGQAVAAVMETHRRTLETVELERRLAVLERKSGGD
jgi:tellurite resistance protein